MSVRRNGTAPTGRSKGPGVPNATHAPQAANAGLSIGDLSQVQPGHPAPNKCSLGDVDLFGEPIVPPRGPGRPRHVPTPESRARVAELRETGLTHVQIAASIGITHPTLELNYPVELRSTSQAWRRRAERDQKG